MSSINKDFLIGNWQGFFIAKASYGVFQDRVIVNFFNNEFDITYFNNEDIRSSAKGTFAIKNKQLHLNSIAEKFGQGQWNHIKSTFVFNFLEKNKDKITLNAKDHLGVEKTLNLEKQKLKTFE